MAELEHQATPSIVDERVVEDLAIEIMRVVRRHYLETDLEGPAIFENLNALAIVVATIFCGTDFAADIEKFFSDALAMQCLELKGGGYDNETEH